MSERLRGPAEEPNFGEPAVPRPSASVVLLRRGGKHDDRALEVLLLKRTEKAKFMPGVWVFPGGAVDAADAADPGTGDAADAADPGTADEADGGAVDGEDEAPYRACAIRELHEEAGIELGEDEELVLFSRWITPEVISRRFDARFFLALAPAHTSPRPDGVETVEAGWFEPAAALEAQAAGELVLAFPTIHQLRSLSAFATSSEAIEAHRNREIAPILPKVIGTREEHRVVLPGDPDYPE